MKGRFKVFCIFISLATIYKLLLSSHHKRIKISNHDTPNEMTKNSKSNKYNKSNNFIRINDTASMVPETKLFVSSPYVTRKPKKICTILDIDMPLNVRQLELDCPIMATDPQVFICLYNENHKASRLIRETGQWEPDIGTIILSALQSLENRFNQSSQTIGFIDLGASIGVHSLPAAKAGYCVLSVEPSKGNAERLHKSVKLNNISRDNILIVNNALSDKRGRLYAHTPNELSNGLPSTVRNRNSHRVTDVFNSIYIDDLLSIITFKRAIMKIDIEGAEPIAFTKAQKLFDRIDITDIFMEWGYSVDYYCVKKLDGENGVQLFNKMVDFFYKNGYTAWTSEQTFTRLDRENVLTWPWDIRWKKTRSIHG